MFRGTTLRHPANRHFFGWEEFGTPEPGKVWFCPWASDLPDIDFDQFIKPTEAFAEIISAKNITRMSLVERLRDLREAPDEYAAKWSHRMRKKGS